MAARREDAAQKDLEGLAVGGEVGERTGRVA